MIMTQARFLNVAETKEIVSIHNRARVPVFFGLDETTLTKQTGYPLLPGCTLRLLKPVTPVFVVK